MPNRDGTGPQGKGSKTGRGVGNCAPKEQKSTSQRATTQRGRRQGLRAQRRVNR